MKNTLFQRPCVLQLGPLLDQGVVGDPGLVLRVAGAEQLRLESCWDCGADLGIRVFTTWCYTYAK